MLFHSKISASLNLESFNMQFCPERKLKNNCPIYVGSIAYWKHVSALISYHRKIIVIAQVSVIWMFRKYKTPRKSGEIWSVHC